MTTTPNAHASSSVRLALLMLAVATASGFATVANAATQRTPQSIECSKQADAKGLHGKEREKFRAACKRHAMAPPHAAPVTQTAPAKSSY